MFVTLIIIVALCVMFAAPLNVALAMVGLIFWSGMGFNAKWGCLGTIFNIIFFVIGTGLIAISLFISC